MRIQSLFLFVSFFAGLATFGTSHAVLTTYTDRTAWEANGTVLYTEDFEGFGSDTSFASSPVDVGPFSLGANGVPNPNINFIDVNPSIVPVPPSFGNVSAFLFVEGTLIVDLIFDNPVSGFFADFQDAGNSEELTLTLSLLGGGTSSFDVPGPGNTFQPFGFFSPDELITSIRFNNTVNDGFYMDNVSASVVPVPAAVWLFGTALAGLVGFSRRRKAV